MEIALYGTGLPVLVFAPTESFPNRVLDAFHDLYLVCGMKWKWGVSGPRRQNISENH